MEKEKAEIGRRWRGLNYNWSIDNFAILMNNNVGEGIASDNFSIEDTKWHFVLHPNGTNQDSRHFVSLWLFNDNQEEFNVEYQVFIGEQLIKVLKASKIKPGQGNGILKLASHFHILEKNFLSEKGQFTLTVKIYQETEGENVNVVGMGVKEEIHHTLSSQIKPQKVLKNLSENLENPPMVHLQDPLALNTSIVISQNSTTEAGVKSKVFLSRRDPPEPIQNKPSFIVPTKTYSKKVSTPTKPVLVSSKTTTKANTAISIKPPTNSNTSNLIMVKKENLTASYIPAIPLKVFRSGQNKNLSKNQSNINASKTAFIQKSKSAIDLPKNGFSSTVISFPIPNSDESTKGATKSEASNMSTNHNPLYNDVPLELSDDTFETGGRVCPNEQIAGLLKIIKNLPSKDQILFIKLLVLQLNDEMLKLIRKLSDSLRKEKEILKYESKRRIDDNPKLFEEEFSYGNAKEEIDEFNKIDIDEFILEPSQVEFKKLDMRIKKLPIKTRESMVVKKELPNEESNSAKNKDPIFENQVAWPYIYSKVSGGNGGNIPWRFDSTSTLDDVQEKGESVFDEHGGESLVKEQFKNIKIDSSIQNNHANVSKVESASAQEKSVSKLPFIQSNPIYACSKCDKLFDNSHKRSKHQRKHSPSYNALFETPVVCDQCSKSFRSKHGWDSHMEIHREENSQEKSIQCEQCPMRFHLKSQFFKHVYRKHTEEACDKCGIIFPHRAAFKRHESIKHNDSLNPNPFQCDQCPKAFRFGHSLKRHKITHTQEKPHSCNMCKKSFHSQFQLKEHSASHGNEKNYKCKDCSKAFKFGSTLYRHRKTWHCTNLPFECDSCPKRFSIISFLHKHKLIHLDNSQRPFISDQCGHGFTTKQALMIHSTINCSKPGYTGNIGRKKVPTEVLRGTSILECNICGKPFKKRSNLVKHIPTHSSVDERLYSCEKCNKSFATTSNLKEHLLVHSSDRPKTYSCERCGKSFVNKPVLVQHIKSHTRPYHCNQCKKSFSKNELLQYHLRTHTGVKPYACDQCSNRFYSHGSMKKHRDKFHSDRFEASNYLD